MKLLGTIISAGVILWSICGIATAEQIPALGRLDAHVRAVDYNPQQVYRLTCFYGVSTHIQFAEDENIVDVAAGDPKAWDLKPRGKHLFLKPVADHADTNMTVVTSKRVYQFILLVASKDQHDETAWSDKALVYSLSFRYPNEQKEEEKVNAEEKRTDKAIEQAKQQIIDLDRPGLNVDYWAAGSDDITPSVAKDDGTFTYFKFPHNADIPSIYIVDENGEESLVNSSVQGDTVIVHQVVRKFVLRKGRSATCIVNKSFDRRGSERGIGTSTPVLEREVKP